ncbi:MAG: NarK [Firmicutes bacterium]|nr:NarK [Bacillota bacterium]
MSGNYPNRWLILAGAVLINMCVGSSYAWSVYQKPLMAMFNWSTHEVSMAFTIFFALVPIAMITGGKIQDRHGPKKVILTGGVLFSSGMIGTGFTDSLNFLYLTYGVLGGLGQGTIVACTIANTVKFFPDKRGFASGFVVSGFAFGAVVSAPVSSALIAAYGVLMTFKILGCVYLLIITTCALFIQTAPSDYRPAGWVPAISTVKVVISPNKDWRELLTDPLFYVLWGMFHIGSISGLMVIGHASPIGQEVIKVDARTAAMAVSLMALGNATGRIFWGGISDKIGRNNAILIIFSLIGIMMFTMTLVTKLMPFMIVLTMIGLCYGGMMGIFPSITADMFGPKNLGMNYGMINTAFGAAAYIGPRLASYFKEVNQGDYTQAFLIATSLSIIGIMLTLIVRSKMKKMEA